MNREIKFRGKDRESWHYGNLVQEIRHNNNKLFDGIFTYIKNLEYKNGDYIGKSFPVNSDTIGQYTGLHDKDGQEIYEGMIINNEYIVVYNFSKFALKNKNNGNIIDFERNKNYEITGEYFE